MVHSGSQMMLSAGSSPAAEGQWADIYLELLAQETKQGTGIQSLYNAWKPWIHMLHPYAPPTDPLDVTLYYNRDRKETYKNL